MKRILIVLCLMFCLGLTPDEITQQYKQDCNTLRTQFKTGQIDDVQANSQYKTLTDTYDDDMYDAGVTTESKANKMEKERRQIVKQKWNSLSDNDLKIILLYLFNGTTYY